MSTLFDLHKCLFTLNYDNQIVGHKIIFVDRDQNEKTITLKKIEITSSPISCKLYDETGKIYITPFIRIKKVFKNDVLVFDNTNVDLSDSKIIKGY